MWPPHLMSEPSGRKHGGSDVFVMLSPQTKNLKSVVFGTTYNRTVTTASYYIPKTTLNNAYHANLTTVLGNMAAARSKSSVLRLIRGVSRHPRNIMKWQEARASCCRVARTVNVTSDAVA
jgi:hypothetical protein